MQIRKQLWCSVLGLAVLAMSPWARADEMADMRATIQNLQSRLEQMESQKVNSVHKEEMAKMMKEMLDDAKLQPAMPKWMDGLKFSGDFRLRYQHDSRGWRRTGAGSHTAKDRNRARFRLRFGFTKSWWEKQLEVGFRLASGSNNDSDSTNQTFTGSFSKKPVWIDLAYAKYKPSWAKGLTVIGGKMKNPIRSKTMVTWDSDINPEGFAVDYELPFFGDFKPYAQVGYWILNERRDGNDEAGRDTTLWTYGAGFNWKIAKDVKAYMGATFYQFDDVNRVTSGWDGNWATAGGGSDADYQNIELTSKISWKMFDLPFQVWGTWVHNCGDDYSVNRNLQPGRKKLEGESDAFGIGLKVGQNKKKGDWSASYAYLYEQANSVPSLGGGFGLGDSDFGGPNRKGHVVGGKYNIDKFLTLGGKVFITDPINSIYGTNQGEDHSVTAQVDLVWKF